MNLKTQTTMRAAVYRGDSRVSCEKIAIPELKAGEVLVRINSCGVCATDLKKVEYNLLPPPRVYGHEMAGTIVRLGPRVKGWRLGERVAVFHHVPCKKCFYCLRKEYAQCPQYKKTGTTAGFEPAGGGFAEYIRVMPWIVKEGMIRVPPKVTLEEACFLEPVNTCLKGVDRLQARKNDVVLVFGQGPIGLLFTQLLRARGQKVFALDLFKSRQRFAKKLGATWSTDPRSPQFEKMLNQATGGRGADAAVLAVPSDAAFQQAVSSIRPGGKVLLFANTKRGDRRNVDAGVICVDEKTILGSYSASIDVLDETVRLVFSKKVKVAPLISHRFTLEDVNPAFELANHPTEFSLKVLVKP